MKTIFPCPHKSLLVGVFLIVAHCSFPLLLFSQTTTNTLIPEMELKALVRDVLFKIKRPNRSNTALFEQIFLKTHASPNSEVLSREFMFTEGEEVPPSYIVQSARHLEQMKIYRSVKFAFDTTRAKRLDVRISLDERPNTAPFLIAETGGGVGSFGVGADIASLGGTATHLRASAEYRTVNAIGWQGSLELETRRLWDWFNLRIHGMAHKYRNEQEIELEFPYSADSPYFEASLLFSRSGGQEFWYTPKSAPMLDGAFLEAAPFELMNFTSNRFSAFGAVRGWNWDNEFFLMGNIIADGTFRADSTRRRVGDNAFVWHIGLGIERRTLELPQQNIDWTRFGTPVQGWYVHGWLGVMTSPSFTALPNAGSLTWLFRGGVKGCLGNNLYASFDAEGSGWRADFWNHNNLFGYFTSNYVRCLGALHWAIMKDMVLANRMELEGASSPLRPMHGAGRLNFIRGFGVNTLLGNMLFLAQTELRGIPIAEVGVYALQGAVFAEFGSSSGLWNIPRNSQPSLVNVGLQQLFSCGAGLRLKYPSFSGEQGTLRLDLAYLPVLGRFGQVIISTQEAFSLFEDIPAKQARLLNDQRWIE